MERGGRRTHRGDRLLRRFVASFFNWRNLDRHTRAHRLLFIVFLSLTYVGGGIYRTYAWPHGLRDFGLADAWPNIWAVPTMTFAWSGLLGYVDKGNLILVAGAAIGMIVYEFLQMTGFLGLVFDWKDIIGTLIGALIALGVHGCVERWLTERAPVGGG